MQTTNSTLTKCIIIIAFLSVQNIFMFYDDEIQTLFFLNFINIQSILKYTIQLQWKDITYLLHHFA